MNDFDAARNSVVDSYIGKCKGIMAVAPIQRAKDNKTAKDVLNSKIRERLFDGTLRAISYVVTQTDLLQPDEIISELNLLTLKSEVYIRNYIYLLCVSLFSFFINLFLL